MTISSHDIGLLILRLATGLVLIAHSLYLKLMVFTLPGTADYFGSIGLPSMLAYIVFALEAVGGLAIIVGVQTRWIAALLVPVLIGATWAHWSAGWLFTNEGGGWEFPAYLAAITTALAALGGGRLTVGAVFYNRGAQ